MLSLPPQVRVFLCTRPTDLRKSFDGLLALAQEQLARDVLQGGLFVFVNRRRDRVKLIWWDGDGLAIFYKRLEAGTFQVPPGAARDTGLELDATELSLLLSGIDLASVKRRKRYRRAVSAATRDVITASA
jgi:transposase